MQIKQSQIISYLIKCHHRQYGRLHIELFYKTRIRRHINEKMMPRADQSALLFLPNFFEDYSGSGDDDLPW